MRDIKIHHGACANGSVIADIDRPDNDGAGPYVYPVTNAGSSVANRHILKDNGIIADDGIVMHDHAKTAMGKFQAPSYRYFRRDIHMKQELVDQLEHSGKKIQLLTIQAMTQIIEILGSSPRVFNTAWIEGFHELGSIL
jgi:hypothetical protein